MAASTALEPRVTAPRRPDTLFWVHAADVEADALTLDRPETHHLLRVHRAERGASFEATDGEGTHYRCRLVDTAIGGARGEILERIAEVGELPGSIRLLVGLPDPRAAESIVEHAVPLGVAGIDFVLCERSPQAPLGSSRLGRMRRLAISGVKQSRRSRLPWIETKPSLAAALDGLGPGARFVADPGGSARGAAPSALTQAAAVVAVGPPGGFTEAEIRLLADARFDAIHLGNNRLTTETASIAILCDVRKALILTTLREI
jgi:16S rRNA (uracil1498-N3)-methyltransferase